LTEALLNEPWATEERQRVATQFGMWSFLATETLFFGGLFLFYAVARWSNTAGFTEGARHTDVLFGTVNTVVLLTSSLTMAIGERAVVAGAIRLAKAMVAATVLLGAAFLTVKGFEYAKDLSEKLVPGSDFPIRAPGAAQFWAFYWTATVTHAIHLTIGLGIVGRLLLIPNEVLAAKRTAAEGTALYWHLIDVVWVFLYPLLYLVGR
jgi:cytochrome c oxidase subunit III